jgi:hypothetical protein
MKQHEVTKEVELLNKNGEISEIGWARRPFWNYSRDRVKASRLQIKEWDYFAIYSHKHQFFLTTTFSDLGYLGLFAIAFIDMKTGNWKQVDSMKPFTLGRCGLPPHSDNYEVSFANKHLRIAYSKRDERRRLLCGSPDIELSSSKGLEADLTIVQKPSIESINIATSWEENRKAFYYNQKINCMGVSGTVRLGETTYDLTPNEAVATLDWGRGRWTYQNRWFWASASGFTNSTPIGFNLGYGFSDRSQVTENALFFNNEVHKIDQVEFIIPKEGYDKPWKITSSDQRIELSFTPVADRATKSDFLIIKSIQHQVFGHFDGFMILDDGIKVPIEHLAGFGEDVFNRF